MKKLLTAFLLGMTISGIKCTKDNPFKPKSADVFLRGEGININGDAQSYSNIVQYIVSPKKKNLKRIGGNGGVNIEVWGNTPDGQVIVRVTNLQSCPNDITVTAQTDFGYFTRTKSFATKGATDTFNFTLDSSKYVLWDSYNSVNCGDFFDPDALSPVSSLFLMDMEQELPMHFKSFDVEKKSEVVYRVTFVITNLENADHINIQTSLDENSWRTIKVIQAKDITLGQPFTTDVKIR